MKKIILLTFSMLFFVLNAFSQEMIDVVYLKNGDVIKGSIIKPLDENGVKIMDSKSDVYSYTAKEVRKVGREAMAHENIKNVVNAYDGNGFTNITTLGYGFGVGSYKIGDQASVDNKQNYFSIQTINGYHLNQNFSVGLGLGVEWHEAVSDALDSYELVPLFVDLRYTPSRKEKTAFFYGDLGYALGVFEPEVDGGLMLGLGAGFQWSLNKRTALVTSFGYRHQKHSFALDGSNPEFDANYLEFKVGLKF